MHALPDRPLLPLPAQPEGVAWPTEAWPEAEASEVGGDGERLAGLLDELVDGERHRTFGLTHAVGVVVGGRLVAERYGRRVAQDLRAFEPDPPLVDVTAASELLSWSMAKSITHLAVGLAVADGRIAVHQPVPEPQWSDPTDERHAITWDDLLAMRAGLQWTEEYYDLVEGDLPDVITMLYGEPAADMAAFAASFPLVERPGSDEAYNYSSGTTNIVAANLARVLGLDGPGMDGFLRERLFDPLGMASARVDFDAAGTFIGSSYVFANLRDWCRFGLLALRGGEWDGRPVVPPGWIDHGRTARSWEDEILYGAHWWTWDRDEMPFGAHGFEGQRVIAFPQRDAVVVRLGQTHTDHDRALDDHLLAIAGCFPSS
ncbi:MAG: serine hydrolase domain-containing protein [Acidimicrobiales bacterium]